MEGKQWIIGKFKRLAEIIDENEQLRKEIK